MEKKGDSKQYPDGNWYIGSRPLTNEQRIQRMKDMWREVMEKEKQKRQAREDAAAKSDPE